MQTHPSFPKGGKPKFILLGWDSADWKIINPLREQGLMPNLEKLIRQGVIANQATLYPSISPMLWTSIATGKRPARHGVLDCREPWHTGLGVRPVTVLSRRCKAVWNILTQEGFKTHVVGWWPSHPAEPVNGISISDFFATSTGRLYEPWPVEPGSVHPKEMAEFFGSLRVHPEELTSEVLELFVPAFEKINQDKDTHLAALAEVTAIAATLHACFMHILKTQEWDFAALYLIALDHYGHKFMRYHPPKRAHVAQPDFEFYNGVVTAGYRFHDLMLGRILEFADENTCLLLVSDHGFQPDHLRPVKIPKEPTGPGFEHSPYGIFVLKGPGIKKNEIAYGVSLLDVTPTILTCLGLPIGADMDGKVLAQVFENEPNVKTVDSWENIPAPDSYRDGMHPESIRNGRETDPFEGAGTAARALQQLADLGYIEKPGEDPEQNRRQAIGECNFNLAKLLATAGQAAEAVPLLEKLCEENPDVSRYAFLLASCYQQTGKLTDCRRVVDSLREREFFTETTLDVMEGALLLGEGKPVEAIRLFKKAEAKTDLHHSRLHWQIAQGYLQLRRLQDAERALLKEIELDYDHAAAHALLGQIYLNDLRFEQAADCLLTAIGLEYEQPGAHFALGKTLTALGDYARAAEAFELTLRMAPNAGAAREELVELYTHRLDQPGKASRHAEALRRKLQGTVVVVSGLPRSGTSMMMQMLAAGGVPVFTDRQRIPDENNPKGYYEHDVVKNLAQNKNWLPQAEGKAVKVVASLLPHLPPTHRYKVIFMERNLREILASQSRMLDRLGKPNSNGADPAASLMPEYERQLEKVKQWASRSANVEICYLKYADVLAEPFAQALQVNEFLEGKLSPESMVQAVDASLHREKAGS